VAEADIIGAIVERLKAQASVAALVGTRVFGGELPPEETAHQPRGTVVIRPAGGGSITAGTFCQHDTQRFDLLAYAATPAEANALARTCRTDLVTLRRKVVAGCLIHWIERAGGFSAGRDRDGSWPLAFQSFQAFYALQEI
jgi:hypothetical protein